MKGDFSRWTFDRTKQYDRVLSLQGRVFLDADFNEGMELQVQRLRRLTADLLGPHAGPGSGFEIVATNPVSNDFFVTSGSYYVGGVLCDNPPVPPPTSGGTPDPGPKYSALPFPLFTDPPDLDAGTAIVYLDVWERFITSIEDEDRTVAERQQSIREVALGGPDTAARSRVVWQVRLLPFEGAPPINDAAGFKAFIQELRDNGTIRSIDAGAHQIGKLKMRARKPKTDDLPCATNPESRYRGPENQLYRVEIHNGGTFKQAAAGAPTFKWSRENGSVIFPIRSIEGPTVTLDALGRDDRLGLKSGDWVEVVDDDYVLQNRAEPLLTVASIDPETLIVELSAAPASPVGTDPAKHPILRRWEGTAPVSINPDPDSNGYLPLEDGVEVRFSEGDYQTSDYWFAPARTATGDVEWPGPADAPQEVPPQGILHAFAPLGVIDVAASGNITVSSSMRRKIIQLWA